MTKNFHLNKMNLSSITLTLKLLVILSILNEYLCRFATCRSDFDCLKSGLVGFYCPKTLIHISTCRPKKGFYQKMILFKVIVNFLSLLF